MNTLYIILVVLIMTISFVGTIINNKGKKEKDNRPGKKCLYLIIFILIMVSGCRDLSYLKGDEYTYRIIFDEINNGSLCSNDNEIGFWGLNYIIGLFTNDSQWLIIVCAIITNVFIVKALYKYSSYFNFSLFLYIVFGGYFASFNIMRQFLAVAVLFYYGIDFIINKKVYKYILCVLLATTLHFSAIILLPMYWLVNIKNKKRLYICTLLITTVSFLTFNGLFKSLSGFDRISGYYNSYNNMNLSVNIFRILVVTLPIILMGLNYNTMKKNNDKFEILYYFGFISMIVMIFSSKYLYFSRLYNYFGIINLLLIPEYIYSVKSQKNRIIILIFVYFLYFLFGFNDQSKTLCEYKTQNNFIIKPINIKM